MSRACDICGKGVQHREEEEGCLLEKESFQGRGPAEVEVDQEERHGEGHRHPLGEKGEQEEEEGARVERRSRPGASEPQHVARARAEIEEDVEEVLPPRDPGDRLDVERMDSKEEGRDAGEGHRAGQEKDEPEHRDRADHVERDIRDVISLGVQPPSPVVEGERYQGQGVIVAREEGGEVLTQSGGVEMADLVVPRDVHGIVPLREVVVDRGFEREERREREKREHPEGASQPWRPRSGSAPQSSGSLPGYTARARCASFGRMPFWTAPERMQRVQTRSRRGLPATTARTVCRFTSQRRLVTLCAWLTFCPC